MAYVQPNSTIQFFKGINLDNRYIHTIYFANTSAQDYWFSQKVTSDLTFTNMMYRRYTSKSVKVEKNASVFHGVTYMRFKNRANGKWFYAFVISADYVNENTTLVTYEIDVMQTWFIQNGTINPCMVLREHVTDDTFGINLEAEPVGSDVYDNDAIELSEGSVHTGFFNQYSVIVSTSEMPDNGQDYNNGMYCGTHMVPQIVTNPQTAYQVTDFINRSVGSWDRQDRLYDIVDLYTFPSRFSSTDSNDNSDVIDVFHPATIGGYTPKNNKLLCYPYTFLFATTMDGDSTQYRWEYFDGDTVGDDVRFEVIGNPLGGGTIICYPRSYNGIEYNYDAKLVMDNFPKNSANIDAYQAWVASGQATKFVNDTAVRTLRGQSAQLQAVADFVGTNWAGLTGTISGIGATLSGAENMGAGKTSGIAQTASGLNQTGQSLLAPFRAIASMQDYKANELEAWNKVKYEFKDAMYVPNTIIGKNTPCVSVSSRALDFYFFNCHVRADEAKRIDDFFSVYGYNIHKVKAPNLTGRAYWNFVMTRDCVISGDMPASSKEAIGRIFDGGITFWHDGDMVGNYGYSTSDGSINNPIVTP